MNFRNQQKNLNPLIRTGLVLLIFATATLFLHHRIVHLSDDLADGVTGLMYGIAIVCLLLGIVRNSRGRCRSENS